MENKIIRAEHLEGELIADYHNNQTIEFYKEMVNNFEKLYSGEDYINPQSKEIIDTVTKETFLSLRQASTVKKINISSLSEMLTGKLRDTTSLCYKKDYFGQIIEPDNRKYKSKIINSETKEIYDNFSDLSRKMNIDKATIST